MYIYKLKKPPCLKLLPVIIVLLTLPFFHLYAQPALPDSSGAASPRDTAATSELDTIITCYGYPIEYDLEEKVTIMHGTESNPAKVVYKDMTLEAGKISFLFDSSMLVAEGIPDTIPGSTTAKPVFRQQGNEPFKGEKIIYNLKTKKGKVIEGRTKYDDGYYSGEDITMVENDLFLIKDGIFTTCDKEDHPHFYFKGGKMKMKVDDKIVVKPVIVYIRKIPIFYLPFGIFPIKKGRHSGLIFPTFGTSQNEGKFLRGLGYYWAPNDYMDAKGIIDYFEKTGFMFRGDVRYSKQEMLSGNISGSITRRDLLTGEKDRQWDLLIDHRHQINPETNFSVNGKFVSGKGNYYRKFSLDREQRATRTLISNATFNKNWTRSKNSISVNVQRQHDLELGNITETLPQINFSHSSPIYLFKGDSKTKQSDEKWYQTINFRYNSVTLNRRRKYRSTDEEDFTNTTRNGVQHSLSFLAPQKVFKWIAVNPFFNYQEEWFLKSDRMVLDEETNELERVDDEGFASRRTFSSGLTANTKFYGLFQPNIGNLKTVRHVVTPSVSFNYRPDFSSDQFGYYKTVRDSTGAYVRYDRFQSSIFGSTSGSRSQSVSFNLQNLFQAKTSNGEEEKKYDLFNLNFSTYYNFAAESFKLGDLTTTFRTMSFFDIDVSTVHSFYQYDINEGKEVDKYIHGLPRLLSFRASSRIDLTGSKDRSTVNSELAPEEKYNDTTTENKQNRFLEDKAPPAMQIPWKLSMGIRYSKTKLNPLSPRELFSITPRLDFNLTKNWKVNYNAEYNLITKEISYHDFSFYRDLHCWEMRFDWTPSGSMKGFFFIIRIKSPSLKDLKVQKRDYGGSVYARQSY